MTKFIIKYTDTEPTYDEFFKSNNIGFRTNNSDYIKKLFTFICTIVSETNIKFTPTGMYIRAMDIGHISLIDCFVPCNLFSTYNCDKEYIIGVNITVLVQILNQLTSDDELIFNIGIDNKTNDVIEICYINSKYDKVYEFKLMDIDQDEMDVQVFEDTTILQMNSRDFHDIIKDFVDIGENLRIKIIEDKNKISFKTQGDMTSLKMVLNNDDITITTIQDICIEFNLKNIMLFSKGYYMNNMVRIELANDLPIKIKYNIGDGFINYYLAPKMEE